VLVARVRCRSGSAHARLRGGGARCARRCSVWREGCRRAVLSGAARLQDEEAVVVQVHALGFEHLRHLREGGGLAVQKVLAGVARVCFARHHQLRVRHHLEAFRVRLAPRSAPDGARERWPARGACGAARAARRARRDGTHRVVSDFVEVHGDARVLQLLVVAGAVDELRHLVEAQLRPRERAGAGVSVAARPATAPLGLGARAAPASRACRTRTAARR
jgi:hypothetical protein